uniref:Uncharacterized protein n=1 Tax=Solanum lycopersicum TaxID=4081 RepID=A0A3Q7EIP9_SOLLC
MSSTRNLTSFFSFPFKFINVEGIVEIQAPQKLSSGLLHSQPKSTVGSPACFPFSAKRKALNITTIALP